MATRQTPNKGASVMGLLFLLLMCSIGYMNRGKNPYEMDNKDSATPIHFIIQDISKEYNYITAGEVKHSDSYQPKLNLEIGSDYRLQYDSIYYILGYNEQYDINETIVVDSITWHRVKTIGYRDYQYGNNEDNAFIVFSSAKIDSSLVIPNNVPTSLPK